MIRLSLRHILRYSFIFAALVLGFPAPAASDSNEPTALQQLIDLAEEGSTILLPEGQYRGPLVIAKRLTIGVEPGAKVELHNSSERPAVSIVADDVVLSGLAIIDRTVKDAPSVLVSGDRAQLSELHVISGSDGIKMEDAHGGEVRGSLVEWGAGENIPFARRGNGIDLYQSHDVRIIGNTVRGVFDGIYMEFSDDTYVVDNRVEHSRYGIHTMFTKGNIIQHNIGTMNITGGMIMSVSGVELSDNIFTKQSENVNSQGILLFDAHDSLVANNLVEGNRVGFYIEHSTGNKIEDNSVTSNFIGMQLLESSENTITGNIFIGNVTDALARGNSINDIQGNYWDSFSGIDIDGDGRSEIRYAIHPFFQGLIQKKPAFQLFFGSPGIQFLESLYASGREAWTTDREPLMAPPIARLREIDGDTGLAAGIISMIFIALALAIIISTRRKVV